MREIDEGYNDRGPGVLVASCSGVLRGYSHHGRGHLQVWPRSLPKWSYRECDTSFLNLVARALFPGFGGGAGKCPGIGWPIRHFDWLIDLGTSCKKMAKWKQFMHYSEIEKAESMSTSTKISARNPGRRLCGGSHESRHMLGIFSKAGLSKDLYLKVYKTCGNVIKFLRTIRGQQCYVGVALHS